MYKPKHKKQMEIKPNGKVVGLAASAVMLATPILQSVSPALAANTDPEPATSDQNTTGTTSKDLVKDDATEYTYANLQTLIDTVTADTEATNSDSFTYPSMAALKTALATATEDSKGFTDDTTTTDVQGVYDPLNEAKAAYDADNTAYQNLSGAIKTGENTATDGFTATSVQALTDALDAAKAIYTTADLTSATFQEEAGKSVTAIQGAISGLTSETPTATLDMTALKDSLATAGNLGNINSKLPTASALADAIATANNIIANSEGLSQTNVDDQNTTLTNAITNYNKEDTAYSALQTAYTDATNKLKDGNNYTADSIAAINTAVDNANTAVDDVAWTADQSEAYVTAANNNASTIQGAITNAQEVTETPTPDLNLSALQDSVTAAEKLGTLTPGLPNTTTLSTALTDAKATIADNGAGLAQTDVDTQNTNLITLTSAYNNENAANDTLQTAYTAAKNKLEDGNNYTADSIAAINTAVTAAQKAVDEVAWTADQSSAYAAAAYQNAGTIQGAVANAKEVTETPTPTLDLSALQDSVTAVEKLGTLTPDLPNTTTLSTALTAAKATIADNGAGLAQTDVDTQNTNLITLTSAYNTENSAYNTLQTAYTDATNKLKDGNNYTADSIAAINTAVDNAKAAVDNVAWTADQSSAYAAAAYQNAGTIQGAVANAKVATETPTPDLDLSTLQASYDKADALGETVPGLPNATALLRAMVAAEATLSAQGTNTDQNGIDAQNTALTKVTPLYQAELTAYNQLKTAMVSGNAKLNDGNNYTTASTQAILSALADANTNVLGATWKSAQSSDYIAAASAATTAITTAVENAEISTGTDTDTTITAAKAVLQSALTTAKSYKATDYTAASYQKLLDAIQTAQGVYLDPNATVAQVQAQTNNLSAVMGALDSTTNVGTVQGIKDLQTQAADLNPWDYTQASWTTLSNALDYAASVLAMDAPTKEQVDYAYTTLDAAISGLKEVGNNNVLKQLGDLYTQVNKLSSSDFTKSTWAKLVTAQTAAKTVLDGGFDASVSSVQAAYDDLQTAVKGLVSVNANSSQKTQLTHLYQDVEYYAQGSVPDETWAAFVTARDNASAALKSEDSTVIDYMNAYDALNEAVANLGTDADMSYIASAAYNNIDGVGKVFFTDGQGIVLYDKPMGKQVSDSDGEGRILDNQSEWKVMRQATLQNGTSWYEVGKNQWVNAGHMMIEQAQIGTIDYLPDMGVNLWAFEPDGLHFTGRRLDNGSAWEMWGSMMINGQQFFNLGANQWVSAEYITISDAE